MDPASSAKSARLNMRLNESQERMLRAAADLTGESLTGFVLAAATARAHEVLERAERITLSVDAFRRFVTSLDEPIEEMPTLRRYARRRGPTGTG